MFSLRMKLGTQPNKLTQDTTLLQNDKCIVKATSGTVTLPILTDNTTIGQLFIGKGQLTLDTIVETPRGAIGKPLIRDLTPNQPFIMLGGTKDLTENLTQATNQDLADIGYKSTDEFLKTANEIFDQFAHNRHSHVDIDLDTHIFAFANRHEKWDFLISKDDKLVYTSKHKVYVSKNNGETVSLGQGSILVARKGKTVVIGGGNILVDRYEQC